VPPGVQAAEREQHPPGGQRLHGLQRVQLAGPPQAPPSDAHLQHQDGGRQVHQWLWVVTRMERFYITPFGFLFDVEDDDDVTPAK